MISLICVNEENCWFCFVITSTLLLLLAIRYCGVAYVCIACRRSFSSIIRDDVPRELRRERIKDGIRAVGQVWVEDDLGTERLPLFATSNINFKLKEMFLECFISDFKYLKIKVDGRGILSIIENPYFTKSIRPWTITIEFNSIRIHLQRSDSYEITYVKLNYTTTT